MTWLLIIASIFIFFRLLPVRKQELNGEVYIIDGDTVRLADGERLRLKGIDAPELSQPGGEEARVQLFLLLEAGNLRVALTGQDKYGRMVGTIYQGKLNVNKAMVMTGFARGDRFSKSYLWQEFMARINRTGLWSVGGISDPRSYR